MCMKLKVKYCLYSDLYRFGILMTPALLSSMVVVEAEKCHLNDDDVCCLASHRNGDVVRCWLLSIIFRGWKSYW